MAKIICPNKQYTGISASVHFANGEGETDKPDLLDWFKNHGYKIVENTPPETDDTDDENEPPNDGGENNGGEDEKIETTERVETPDTPPETDAPKKGRRAAK